MIYAYTARIDGKLVVGEIEADCAANARRLIHARLDWLGFAVQKRPVLITKIFTPPLPLNAPLPQSGVVHGGRRRAPMRAPAP